MKIKYIFYWRDGKTTVSEGEDHSDAFTKAGYGLGALGALDWYDKYDEVKGPTHTWDPNSKQWNRREPIIVIPEEEPATH